MEIQNKNICLFAYFRQNILNFLERTIHIRHKSPTRKVDDSHIGTAERINTPALPWRSLWIVGRPYQIRLLVNKAIYLSIIPYMVARGNNIGSSPQQLIHRFAADSLATSRIFAIDNNHVHIIFLTQFLCISIKGFAASTPYHIAYKHNLHANLLVNIP